MPFLASAAGPGARGRPLVGTGEAEAGAAGPGPPRAGPDWAGLPEDVLVQVAGKVVAQHEAAWAAYRRNPGRKVLALSEKEIQEEMAKRKRDGTCPLFIFATVCKPWRKAQLRVGGRLRTWVRSGVILPGRVALVKWALAKGCPRTHVKMGKPLFDLAEGPVLLTLAQEAAKHGNIELVRWLIAEQGFDMDMGVMWYAGLSGHLELVNWLRDNRQFYP